MAAPGADLSDLEARVSHDPGQHTACALKGEATATVKTASPVQILLHEMASIEAEKTMPIGEEQTDRELKDNKDAVSDELGAEFARYGDGYGPHGKLVLACKPLTFLYCKKCLCCSETKVSANSKETKPRREKLHGFAYQPFVKTQLLPGCEKYIQTDRLVNRATSASPARCVARS
jgi:hypothetical protein